MKIFKVQQGIVQIPLLVVLVVGIIIGVILVQKQTHLVPKASECSARPACLDATPACNIMEPRNGWCAPTGAPKPTCMPRPACLDSNPRCLIAEPAEGWCPENTPRSCNPVKSVTPYNFCGKDTYKNATYVCGDGTRGQIGSGGLWGRPSTSACKSLGDLKQDVAQRCIKHSGCQPGETSIPSPSFVPNPTPPISPLSCKDCPSGFSLCKNKTTEKLSCINRGEVNELSTNLTCNSCPRIEPPPPSSSPDTGI